MKNEKIVSLLPYFIAAIALLAVKLFLIEAYGSLTPWEDQWTAEGKSLYRPWLLGELPLEALFSGHNEHRIFTSRVLSLLLFELDGQIWNPVLQMRVNAVLHVLALGVFVVFSARILSHRSALLLIVFTLALNAYPFGFANTLFGFQSCVYLLMLFAFIFLWCMSAYDSYSPAWWLGLVSGLLCVLTFASGAVAIIAGLLILIFRKLTDQSASGVSNTSLVLVGVAAVLAIIQTPTFTPDIPLRASDFASFFHALVSLLSWPVKSDSGGIAFTILIIHLPFVAFALTVFREASFRTPGHLFVLAVGAWVIGQILVMAYGRGSFYYLTSRYLDLYAIGLLAGCVALLALLDRTRLLWIKPALMLIWVGTIAYGFAGNWNSVKWQLNRVSREGRIQEINIRNYLLSGDRSYLVGKPRGEIPLQNAKFLIKLLDDPQMRVFFPRNIYVPGTAYDEVSRDPQDGAGG